MVLTMTKQLPPDQFLPKRFWDYTEKNKGKAVMNENGAVYLKDGSIWPGGQPFLEPKTGLEVMANVKFGLFWDDLKGPRVTQLINQTGKVYKNIKAVTYELQTTCRMTNPPIGSFKGLENIKRRRVTSTYYPRNIKGLGNYIQRYYDDAKDADTGFLYLPAFKRVMRFSTTNYQDNIEGADITWGDVEGLYEPLSTWEFKLVKDGYILLPEPKSPFRLTDDLGNPSDRLKFDVGRKFPRLGWTIYPVHIIEANCRHKHIYGKKVLYCHRIPCLTAITNIGAFDAYDRKMQLWKGYVMPKGNHYVYEGDPYASNHGAFTHDLQADHTTQSWMNLRMNMWKYKPADVTLKQLIRLGR
jgi:hypothetical protein